MQQLKERGIYKLPSEVGELGYKRSSAAGMFSTRLQIALRSLVPATEFPKTCCV